MLEEISGLLKSEIIEKFEKYQTRMDNKIKRLQKYHEESIATEKALNQGEIRRLRNQLNKALPVTEHLKPLDLFYYKPRGSQSQVFYICKKDSLRFDKYQLGRQIYELPDEYKINDLRVIIIAEFDYNKNFLGYRVRDRRMRNIVTYHTNGDVCLGENIEAISMVKFDDGQTIINGFNSMKETLETINPESYLGNPDAMSPRLQKTNDFIKSKLTEYKRQQEEEEEQNSNNNERCPICGEPYEYCDCAVCRFCEASLNPDSERCPHCGRIN